MAPLWEEAYTWIQDLNERTHYPKRCHRRKEGSNLRDLQTSAAGKDSAKAEYWMSERDEEDKETKRERTPSYEGRQQEQMRICDTREP